MIRLTILTLLGLFAVLALFGAPDPDAQAPAPVEEVSAAEPAPLPAEPEPAPAAPLVPAAAVEQTPEQVQQFPGPDLKPSPEYAGQPETGVAKTGVAGTGVAGTDLLEASGAEIRYVTGDRVNFRAGPSTGDRVIGALGRGSPVEMLRQTDDGWVQLRDAEGREGYMSAQFLATERPD